MTISPAWADRLNSAVEFAILVPFALDCLALVKARDSVAISLNAQLQYLAYCTWSGVYFATLSQWLSAASAAAWVSAYVVRVGLVLRYRRKREPS